MFASKHNEAISEAVASPLNDNIKVYPALKYSFLTPYYDQVVQLFMPEKRIRQQLLKLCALADDSKVLDYGCGTGSMLDLIYKYYPETELVGFDPDPLILQQAKTRLSNTKVRLEHSLTYSLQYGPFDRIVSTWVFHHLTDPQKEEALTVIKNHLKKDGLFIIADWGKPANWLMKICSFGVQLVDNFYTTSSNYGGELPDFLKNAGFNIQRIEPGVNTAFGTLYFHICSKIA